jgi:Rps23 Pro-64 3,4-dihydroxylase Tpa1-like proline 4-hydroxylase
MERREIAQFIVTRLENDRAAIEAAWNNPQATRTRHFIVDDLLPKEIAEQAYAAFPRDGSGFSCRETFREKKRTSAHLSEYAPILGEITYAIQDPDVVGKVSELVGFKNIEPDPSLYAGGLSMMFKDDFLNPHVDNSHDAKRDRYRRINLLYYVSPDWSLENGGNFELWDDDHTVPVPIISAQNRLLVMETNKSSLHSVNKVLVDRPRCCISNYYFSETSPDETEYFHVTSFYGRPEEPIKKVISAADNVLRNLAAKTLKVGRGKNDVNATQK